MASIEQIWLEIENCDREWNELKPLITQYLPGDLAKVNQVERLMARRRRYFERGSQAEKQGRKLPTYWWYCQVLVTSRKFSSLVDILGERGLQAQEQAKRQRKATG